MDRRTKLIEDLIQHLEGSQGDDLMGLIEKSKKPSVDVAIMGDPKPDDFDSKVNDAIHPKDDAAEEASETPGEEMSESKGDDDMSDEELAQLLKEYIK